MGLVDDKCVGIQLSGRRGRYAFASNRILEGLLQDLQLIS